ncbi:MAG: branched-chain amino acid ABC transporter permease [Afipia sp.]|nr:branched-chain amino acid ABC transporter permease [Afipia sp.]
MTRTGWIVTAIILLALPLLFKSSSALTILCQIGVMMIFASAYNLLLGRLGLLSFGHAVFFGIAGFGTAHLISSLQGGMSAPVLMVLPIFGALVGLIAGALVGFISTRSGGIAFAMISLGIAELVSSSALIFVSFFQGEAGVSFDRTMSPHPFGITFGPILQVYYLVAGWCFVSLFLIYHFSRTPLGIMCLAVRDNAERVAFLGYRPARVRLFDLRHRCIARGVAGTLHAITFEHIGFESLGLAQSGLVLFMTYIGGSGILLGPALGALIVTLLQTLVSRFTSAWAFYLGITFVLIVLFAPGGLAGLIASHWRIWRADRRALMRLIPSYAVGAVTSLVGLAGVVVTTEMASFATNAARSSSTTVIFGLSLDIASAMPWLVATALMIAGFVLCRHAYPSIASAYRAANQQGVSR